MKDKRSKMKTIRNTKYEIRNTGFTLLFASLIGALMLAIGLSIFNLIFKELVLSSTISESQGAFVAADSAAECALFWDTQHPGYSNSVFGGDGQNIVPNGLVGYWKFDEGPGTGGIAPDSAGDSDGTLTNMTSADWVEGKINNSLDFDGVNDFVRIPHDQAISLTTYSYAFWIKLNSGATGVFRQVLVKGNGSYPEGRRAPGIWLPPTGTSLHVVHGTGPSTQEGVGQTSNLPVGTWTHVVVTATDNPGQISVYLDGSLDQSDAVQQNLLTNSDDLYLGDSPTYDPSAIVLDELRIYNRVLTLSEISILRDQTAPDGSGVVAQGSDLSCNGSDITDPVTGWDDESGWDVILGSGSDATTVFDVLFDDLSCAEVTVAKTGTSTTIDSRGYNSCSLSNPRRVERGIRITY